MTSTASAHGVCSVRLHKASTDIESASPVNMTLETKGIQRSMHYDTDNKSYHDESQAQKVHTAFVVSEH